MLSFLFRTRNRWSTESQGFPTSQFIAVVSMQGTHSNVGTPDLQGFTTCRLGRHGALLCNARVKVHLTNPVKGLQGPHQSLLIPHFHADQLSLKPHRTQSGSASTQVTGKIMQNAGQFHAVSVSQVLVSSISSGRQETQLALNLSPIPPTAQ